MKTYAYATIVAAAAAIAIGLPATAQQPAPSGYEKKEFTHSAWTRGIFSEAVTVKGAGNGKFVFLAGVGAEDENGPRGNIRHHGDLVAQCEYAFDKIKRVLAAHEIAPEPTGHGLPLGKCEAYNRVYDQFFGSS